MLRWLCCCLLLLVALNGCAGAGEEPSAGAREPVIGGPCEGCELVFTGMPEALEASARIALPGEPGEPMTLEGTVRDQKGGPAPGVIVYAYHTDASGVYPHGETRHGRLRAWARTDEEGRYRFDTIRPGSYPTGTEPAHVHLHVIEPGCCTYYVESLLFSDDPLLPGATRYDEGRGGSGVATPRWDDEGRWEVTRDIVRGEGVPGHPGGGG